MVLKKPDNKLQPGYAKMRCQRRPDFTNKTGFGSGGGRDL
jgi:hypothetical protein